MPEVSILGYEPPCVLLLLQNQDIQDSTLTGIYWHRLDNVLPKPSCKGHGGGGGGGVKSW